MLTNQGAENQPMTAIITGTHALLSQTRIDNPKKIERTIHMSMPIAFKTAAEIARS